MRCAAAFLLVVALHAGDGPALAGAAAEIPAGRVAAVPDGMTLVLGSGATVRLAGIAAPLPPLGQRPDAPSPWADASRAALSALALGRVVGLRGDPAIDRYGRTVAQVFRDDGAWLEGELLAQGAAWVETVPQQRDLATAMLAREAEARRHGRGLWQSPRYAVRAPDQLEHASGRFALVEGGVAAVEDRHGVFRLSFAEGDLEAEIARPATTLFRALGLDPRTLAGRRIRLRGWLRWAGHPILELTHPEQVELLDNAPPAPP